MALGDLMSQHPSEEESAAQCCRAQEALREREARLAAALCAAKIGVYDYDPRTKQVIWDAVVYRLWGVPECEPVTYETFEAAVHPEDVAAVRQAIGAALHRGGTHHYECEYRVINRADGSLRWVLDQGDATFDAGLANRLVGTVQDITARKNAEAALQESEARYRQLFDSMTEGFLLVEPILDENGKPRSYRYLTANPALERLTHLKCKDILGKDVRDVLPSVEGRWIETFARVALTGEPSRIVEFSQDLDGWYDVYAYCPRPGQAALIYTNVTARKQAEERLRESEATLRAVLDGSLDPIFMKDREGRMVLVNPATCAAIGKPAEFVLGKTDEEFLDNPADARAIMANDRRIMLSGEPETVEEAVSPASGIRYYVNKKVARRDAAGNVIGLISTARDVTERKRAEERIELLMREVNHRSKNMLTVVQSIARQTVATNPEGFLERFGERVQALAASQDLLIKHGWKGVQLEELARLHLSPFGDLLDHRIELQGPPILISASAAQAIGMAIHELATNAGKYGALSGLSGRVDVRWHVTKAENGEQAFVMSWTEEGGPPVVMPAQLGFGSKVIGHLIESSLTGTVELDFPPPGLSWRLTCPKELVEGCQPRRARAQPVPVSAPSRTLRRILVVEDEPLVALEIAHILTKAGFEVVGPTRDVAGAMSLLEQRGCDAAVLDINLGRETSEPVALELIKRKTAFVTLSGYSEPQQTGAFGGAPVLAKPINPKLLIATIRQCLDEGARAARIT